MVISALSFRLLPSLGLLLLAAHFLRLGEPGHTAALVILTALAWTRQAWARWALCMALAVGTLLWLDTAAQLAGFRLAAGMPWLRLVLILGAVALASATGAFLLALPGARKSFPRGEGHARAQAAAFAVTAALLLVTRAKSPLALLLADRFLPGWGGLEILGLALYADWLAGIMLRSRRTAKIRLRLWTIFSALFFLQLALGLAGAPHMLMTGKLHLPVPALILAGPLYRGHGLFMLILFASTVLLAGPAWCSHLCYVGAWDGLSAARRGNQARQLSALWIWGARTLVLALVLAAALGLRWAGVAWPFAATAAAAFGLAGVGVMLMLSRRMGLMVHCTTWCPMGLVAVILGRVNPFRMRMAPDCTGCGACSTACRYSALGPRSMERKRPGLSCTLCGDCVSACPHGRMRYALPGLRPETARTAFIVLVTALHAVFLGVARI